MKIPYWIVTADTQLGAIHWSSPEREEDYYRIFQELCRTAAEDTLCLGILGLGDLRERASIQAKNLGGMNRGLKILLEAGKPLLALMGNHDFTTPNWIEEMCYPSLENLVDKKVQEKHGFNPDTTLALDFHPKGDLERAIAENCNPEKIEVAFLHQSLRELTTSLKQSHDTSLERLEEIGFGKVQKCLFLMGDLHNFGDCSRNEGLLSAAYPGSPEMTDANEGSNGLKSERVQSEPHDYRKFAIRYYPGDTSWEPFELNPRPWFRGKAKTEKETDRLLGLLAHAASAWKMPGCASLTAPRKDLERVREALRAIPTLEARVEEYDPDQDETTQWETTENEGALNWPENKKALLELAESSALDVDALALLKEIVSRDGSTPNPKNDVANAWSAWISPQKIEVGEIKAALPLVFQPNLLASIDTSEKVD